MKDRPRSLKVEAEREARKKMLQQEHMLPLTRFVNKIRKDKGPDKKIPFFDPLDGGTGARCLFVLEAPGRKAVESGFISRNNNDQSAENFFECTVLAGLTRERTITWNIVPWYLGTGRKVRAAKKPDIKLGTPYLLRLTRLLPRLRVIVLVGGKAQTVETELRLRLKGVDIIQTLHPSPKALNRKQENKKVLIRQLKQVRKALDHRSRKNRRGPQ